jgi:DNA-binding NarL/FixJ family response regulator
MATKVRIVIAVTQRAVRQGARLVLGAQSGLQVVGEAERRGQALALAARLRPDVMVVDQILPGIEFLDFLRRVGSKSPRTRIVVLKTPADAAGVARASVAQRLIRATRDAALRRRLVKVPLPAAVIDMQEPDPRAPRHDPGERLTPREREIVFMAADGFSSTETARRLGISPRTVESHRTRAMRKLGLHRRAELVRYAVSRGILPAERGGRDDS